MTRLSPFPLRRPARLAVMASGRGSNLQTLLDEFGPDHPQAQVVLVVSDRAKAQALERARLRGVEAHHIRLGDRAAFEAQVTRLLEAREIDLVCLAGFMRLLSPEFVDRFGGRIINIHPSLLPKFRGLHAHRQALAAGVRESGCTVHFVDAGVDTGGVILQRRVPVLRGDDEERLAARILEQEHLAYPQAVRLVLAGAVKSMVTAKMTGPTTGTTTGMTTGMTTGPAPAPPCDEDT
ncbi:MAG: phosphoribosylglycinamide formyltransferase [Trueperaceae bacterium]